MFYDYICQCGYEQEEVHGMTEEPIITCPKCDTQMTRRIYGGSSTHFKGSGWAGKPWSDSSQATKVTQTIRQEQINGE